MRSGILSVLLALSPQALAADAGRHQTPEFAAVRAIMDEALAAAGDPSQVLVVFDIDNTILATDDDLAGEHWFLWQSEMIKAGNFDDGAVAKTLDELLVVQGWLYTIGRMHAVEPRIPDDVKQLASRGTRFMALTSRNPEIRDVTLRELAKNGFDLGASAPGPSGGYAGPFVPEAGAKPVIFERGVMLTSGQNKGVMLRALLAKTGATFSDIVFVDDRPHHLEGVQAAFADRPERVRTVRYVHELPRVEAFHAGDKAEVKGQWCALAAGFAAGFSATRDAVHRASGCSPTGRRQTQDVEF